MKWEIDLRNNRSYIYLKYNNAPSFCSLVTWILTLFWLFLSHGDTCMHSHMILEMRPDVRPRHSKWLCHVVDSENLAAATRGGALQKIDPCFGSQTIPPCSLPACPLPSIQLNRATVITIVLSRHVRQVFTWRSWSTSISSTPHHPGPSPTQREAIRPIV